MNYEVVDLEEKIVVGVSAKTGNDDPKMQETIGNLWVDIYGDKGIYNQISNKVNERAIGLYSDYTDSSYIATAGCEVSKADNKELTTKIIPAGKYAKFSVHGPMDKAVADAWDKIWKMDLPRSFTADFEEYLNSDMEEADIDLYIALK